MKGMVIVWTGFFALLMAFVVVGKLKAMEKPAEPGLQHAAELGNAREQYELAHCYQEGCNGFEKSVEKAFIWYKRAAKQSNILAQEKLAAMYEKDECPEGKSYSKANKYYLTRIRSKN